MQEMKHKEHNHHAHMLEDFKRRFIVSLILTVPILALSKSVQPLLGFRLEFPGSTLVLFLLSSFIYFYGGHPFLKGLFDELKKKNPGMMVLIAVAISVAYFYSYAVFLISNIRSSVFQLAFWQCPQWLWGFNVTGFFVWGVWGLVLGYLYKKG